MTGHAPLNEQLVNRYDYFVHESAYVDLPCQIGAGTRIWHYTHVMAGAQVGDNCILGQNVMVAGGAVIGSNVKIQNNVAIYDGTVVDDDVFLGPSCVLTNVTNPRSQVVRRSLYERTLIRRGATVGANATIICGIAIGRYAFIGAGSVVAASVPDYGLILGVPGRLAGWISRHGHRLAAPNADGVMVCPEGRYRYKEIEPGIVRCLDLDEEHPLPSEAAIGRATYDEFKKMSQPSDRA